MRLATVLVVAFGLSALAAADPLHTLADDATVCGELRAAISAGGDAGSDAPCERVSSQVVRGLGRVDVWTASGIPIEQTWVMAIHGRAMRVSPMLDTMDGEDCAMGHCVEITATPAVRQIHSRGRNAVVLELAMQRRGYCNACDGPQRAWTAPEPDGVDILACGVSPAGIDACATLSISGNCRLRLADGVSAVPLDDSCTTTDDPNDTTRRCELRFLADGTLGRVCTPAAEATGR